MKSNLLNLCLVATITTFGLMAGCGSEAIAQANPQNGKVNVFIQFKQKPGNSEKALVEGIGGNVKHSYHLVPAIAASIPENAINALKHNPNISLIEPDIEVRKVDAELDNTWGVKKIGSGAVHTAGNKGTGIKVAVIDSGINYNHTDLNANYAGGYDFVNKDASPLDDDGHGTHVAGTIAAEDDNSGVIGVAPEASIYGLKVLNSSGGGSYSDIIAALQWAVDNGIQVTNNSYGSSGDPGLTVKAAFDNANSAGIVNLCAAGNSGNRRGRGENVIYPAKWDSCIAVAATDSSNNRASFSSTGPEVEISAPGVSIKSTLMSGGYGNMSGTSMASPHVAGTAALIIKKGVVDTNLNGKINDEVRQILNSTADELGTNGRDYLFGFGLIDTDGAAL